jgi:hypothetical protein
LLRFSEIQFSIALSKELISSLDIYLPYKLSEVCLKTLQTQNEASRFEAGLSPKGGAELVVSL